MKVLNLRCSNGHGFEGWFASDEEFMDAKRQRRAVVPVVRRQRDHALAQCAAAQPLGRPRSGSAERAVATAPAAADPQANDLQAMWLKAVRHVMANTEDVGERFAEEARRIHYGEAPERGIRGQVNPEQRDELIEEGIEIIALPLPRALDGPLQ